MGRHDELDSRRAAAFAWRFARPGEPVILLDDESEQEHASAADNAAGDDAGGQAEDDDKDDPTDTTGRDDEDEDENDGFVSPWADPNFFQEAEDTCAALMAELERIELLPEPEQAGALEPILLRAEALEIGLGVMQSSPCESIRLLRLALRRRGALSKEAWQAACSSAAWLGYQDPALIDLLVEVAVAGARSLANTLMRAVPEHYWSELACLPGAIARLVALIDHCPSYAGRAIAIAWISFTGGSEAVPALRRALRAPHLVLRVHALDVLTQRFPDRIEAEDVACVLKDVVFHVAPDHRGDEDIQWAKFYLPGMLQETIARLRPRQVIEPLVCLIEECCTPQWNMTWGLDASWALCLLARIFPEQAVPHIDRRLMHALADERMMATEAAGALPDALAQPRLLLAAADPVPEIAEAAQTWWLRRYASLCPLDPLAGMQTALLEGPPSEIMRSRLELLRRGPLEARAAMVEVLLGEAPSPEALVLLLFAVIDSRLWESRPRPGLPRCREMFTRILIERFGARAIQGIAGLDACYPEGGVWLRILLGHLPESGISEAACAALRAAAARHLACTADMRKYYALMILAAVGAPPELARRLFQLACDPAQESYFHSMAIAALARLPAHGDSDGDGWHLDTAVRAEMAAALAESDIARFAFAAAVGLGRKLPEARALIERTLGQVGSERPREFRVLKGLAACIEALVAAGYWHSDMLRAALDRPGTCLCAMAAGYMQQVKLRERDVRALEALLACEEPFSTATAACVLVLEGRIGPEHAALPAIAARAPLPLRSELIYRMWKCGASLSDLWPLMEPLLTSADPDVTEPMRHLSEGFAHAGLNDRLQVLLPQIVDSHLRRDIRALIAGDDAYWQDQPEQ